MYAFRDFEFPKELKVYDISTEEYRVYFLNSPDLEEWCEYRIDNPVALVVGETTHRVVDNQGVVHCVPNPSNNDGVVLNWKTKNPKKPVQF